MKKSELKKILKPLIKQCIKEVIFEEGVLSGLISEVVQGLGPRQIISEEKQYDTGPEIEAPQRESSEPDPEFIRSLQESRRNLEQSLGSQFEGVFENTAPLSRAGSLGESKVQSPLSTYGPDDAGVDITGLMKLGSGKNWKHMI